MKQWSVASSVLSNGDGYLLVANRRRNGSVDWSPPGGVVDDGETPVEALGREVAEETGLVVDSWDTEAYNIEVRFIDLRMHLTVVTMVAGGWTGDIVIDDPDGIVEEALWCDVAQCEEKLASSPRWVREPFLAHLSDHGSEDSFFYDVRGEKLATAQVERVDS